jgi:dynein heavy chain
MSEDLEKMSDAIFDNRVPPRWTKLGFLSLKALGSWIEDCNARINFLKQWINHGTPKVYWVSGFFFPQAFFTGTLQNYARLHTIPVDKLSFDFLFRDDITFKDVTERPESGALCYGLYLEGCKWDYEKHMLGDSDPKKLFVDLPMLHFIPKSER